MVIILDTTLREGEQTPNVKFSKKQKIEIATLLDDFGIDIIEVGKQSFCKTMAFHGVRIAHQTTCH